MKQKLELTWAGKDEPLLVEPRILLYDEKNSHGAQNMGNLLIHGDNLLALKALEAKYAGQAKCVYIDPPYNTQSAFTFYDDNFEHSLWLSMMKKRIEIIGKLLSEEGSLWISIDDNERDYLKIMCDEVFGRNRFITSISWQSRYSRSNDAIFSISHNYILIYAINPDKWKVIRNRLERTPEQAKQYKNPDNDPNGPWRAIPWDAPNIRPNLTYPITNPKGIVKLPPAGRCWSRTKEQWDEIVNSGMAYFGKNGDGAPSYKAYLRDAPKIVPNTWWSHEEAGHTDEAKKEIVSLFGKKSVFDTPKPERLIQRVLEIATNPGDLVLDSFLGSGTTAAVAHKMNRRYIGIEMGDHAYTHCKVRLDKVIDGEDSGGITKAVNWQGGGGYRFYELAPTLIKLDSFGEPVISEEYDADRLAAAVALNEGYVYQPDSSAFWKQARGSEKSWLFTTTRTITAAYLDSIAQDLGEGEFLTIAATSFAPELAKAYKNITLRLIPQMLLKKCTFGVDNYNLPIVDPPKVEDDEELREEGGYDDET